jgi:imidazolonepropionase-like amidohydrolase
VSDDELRTTITNVRVFDGDGLTPPQTVVLAGGLIASVTADGSPDDGSGAAAQGEVVDGHGGTLLPGLIDAHVHLNEGDAQVRLAAYGVTTALDMGTWPASLVASLRGRRGVTDIRSSGVGASSPASAHAHRAGRPAEGMVSTPEDAEPYVAGRVAEGVDYIKVIIDLPGFDQPTLDALVTSAHRHDRLTIMHASELAAVRMAQAAGVDVLTHAPLDRPMEPEDVARTIAEGRASVPTLAMMEGIAGRFAGPDGRGPSYEAARATVAALHRAGVPVIAGTDANEAPGVPFSPPYGDSLHHELELLVGAGLTPVEALRAATSVAAEHFGLDDRGAVRAGLRADVVLVDGDPTTDIMRTRALRGVWIAGERVPLAPHEEPQEAAS